LGLKEQINWMEFTVENLGKDFWNNRWETQKTGWDIGYASPAITDYMAKCVDKNAPILVPGCGNAHEASFLLENGFTNITLVDIAPLAVERLQEKFKQFHQIKIVLGDFYLHEGKYEILIEQTFFCANLPASRGNYVKKAADLLNHGGRLIGVLFNREFEKQGPPFGGNEAEYKALFSPFFTIEKMELCYNSIAPRMGNELFINLLKK
jgi:SAM-dependent methyltransferase